jgi:hypothetical protein
LVRWYTDWDMFKALPYGGTDVLDQPHFVVQILRKCIDTNLEVDREAMRKAREEDA